ncbi:hypothetical protein [Nocardia asteroides]
MESVDRQALLDAGLDPDDPQTWATQQRISDLLVCYGIARRSRGGAWPDLQPGEADR